MGFELPQLADISPNDLREWAILVAFEKSEWTPTARDRSLEDDARIRHGYDGDATFRKTLINKAWLAEFRKVRREAYNFHMANTLPWTDKGFRILLGINLQRYYDAMSEFKMRAEVLVEALRENWPTILEEARRLWPGDLFDPSDYPTQEQIPTLFGIDWKERPIPDANDFRLKDLNPAMQEVIQKKMDAEIMEAIRVAQETPFQMLIEAIERVVDTLSAEGKKKDGSKRFEYTMISHLARLVDSLPGLNLTKDPRLEEITQDARDLLSAMSGEISMAIDDDDELKEATQEACKEIRKDEALRAAIHEDAKKALDKMKGFMGGTK